MKLKLIVFFLICSVVCLQISCRRNHFMVNTSDIEVRINIKRLEKDLFTINPDKVIEMVPAIKMKYGAFLQLFSYVINTGDINEDSFSDFLLRFCSDKQNNEVYNLTIGRYPDVSHIEKGLADAFRHYIYYFPQRSVPAVFTCITGFNNSIITGDTMLGISLDRYLGPDCRFYPMLNIYKYIAARMTAENIVPDCMFGWAASEWDFSAMKYPADNVLTEIIHSGKLKYFEKCMLPETSDELIFGFTSDQLKFCRNNESQMWQYLIENNLLFSTDQFTIRKLIGEAPFTSFFTRESPGQAAVWIGFRIVESYMIRNPSVSLQDMINNTDIQIILEKAKYSPQ